MPSGRVIRIGLETDFLNAAMTGVGNYCFHLLSALMEHDRDFQFSGFSRLTWQPFNEERLRQIDRIHGKTEVDIGASTTMRSRASQLERSLRTRAARFDLARRIYRAVQRSRFRRGDARGKLDLFHAFRYLPPIDLDVPVLPVVYDLSFVRFPDTHPRERLKELERLPDVISRAPFVHTISEFSKTEIADVYGFPRDRIIVAPPAPSAIFRPLGPEITQGDISSFGLVADQYFLAVGTLEPRKNLRTLIAAYSALPPMTRSRSPLVIAGGGGWGTLELPPSAERMMNEGSLRFVGAVSDAKLRSLYEGARALLFPSIYEGFGMPAVEAMACGTQVIHSSSTSMDEITEGTSPTVPAMDESAWSAALLDLLESPALDVVARELSVARSHRFSWRDSAETIAKIYRTVCPDRF